MENEFMSIALSKESNNTFPVKIAPITITNKQLMNKIRINHQKLPTQFFLNPRSISDLDLFHSKTPIFERSKAKSHHRQNNQCFYDDEYSSKGVTKSLKSYRSLQKTYKSKEKRKKGIFMQHQQPFGVTFSRLPMKMLSNERKLKIMNLKKIFTEPYENEVCDGERKNDGKNTMRIDFNFQSRRGIHVRKNNHTLSALKQLKAQQN